MNNKYKLVAIDCDNTLLDSKGFIPKENKKTIKYLQEKGVQFVIATGRNDILVADYIEELGIKAPVIGCNGASIRDLKTNQLYKFDPISHDALKSIFKYCTENKIDCKAFSMEKCYENTPESLKEMFPDIIKSYAKKLLYSLDFKYIKDLNTIIGTDEIIKVVIVDNDYDFVVKTREALNKIPDIDAFLSARDCIDIEYKNVSKGQGLKHYAELINIAQEDIVAIGDNENDISMIQYAGFGVAMENGEEKLKEIADYITCTNNEAGVSKALIKIFEL